MVFSEGKADYGVALTMNPNDVDLQSDFTRITLLAQCTVFIIKKVNERLILGDRCVMEITS